MKRTRQSQIRELTVMAAVAALYVALCYVFASVSYGPVQFRIAEVLLILAVYNKKYCVPVIIGTFMANALMFGLVDMIVGTFATVLALAVIISAKGDAIKKIIAAPAAAIINGVVIGLMLVYLIPEDFGALWFVMLTVAAGEFAVVLAGTLAFAGIEKINPRFISMIKNINTKSIENINNRGE